MIRETDPFPVSPDEETSVIVRCDCGVQYSHRPDAIACCPACGEIYGMNAQIVNSEMLCRD